MAGAQHGDASVVISPWNAEVRLCDREVMLSHHFGGLISFRRGELDMVVRRPDLTCFRALTDNDRGNGGGMSRAQWALAGRYARVASSHLEQEEGGLVADYEYELATPERTKVTDEMGRGMRVSAAKGHPFAFSLLPYSSMMLDEAWHRDELPEPRHMFLRLLAGQMGVGGDDSWGAPVHEPYQLASDRPLTLDVTLELL